MDIICPICQREMIAGKSIDEHHLIPKTFKGKETIALHRVCHEKCHTVFTEKEMRNYYHTIERLLEHSEIQKFVKWVHKYDPEFYTKNKDTQSRRNKRRR